MTEPRRLSHFLEAYYSRRCGAVWGQRDEDNGRRFISRSEGYITRLWREAFPSRRERSVRGLSSKFTGVSCYTSAFTVALAERGASSFKVEVTQMKKKKRKKARLRHQRSSGSQVKRGSARCGGRWCTRETWNIHPKLWGVGSNLRSLRKSFF